jgi:hypothetical protein
MVDLTIVAKPRRMSEPVWVSMVVEQLMKKKRKASSQTQKKRGEGRGRSNRERKPRRWRRVSTRWNWCEGRTLAKQSSGKGTNQRRS